MFTFSEFYDIITTKQTYHEKRQIVRRCNYITNSLKDMLTMHAPNIALFKRTLPACLEEIEIRRILNQESHNEKAKLSKTQKRKLQYIRRNEHRNKLLESNMICKCCGTVWPAGSIKKQAFESIQSLCNRDIRKCKQSVHAWKCIPSS